jgi:hypothetical protein
VSSYVPVVRSTEYIVRSTSYVGADRSTVPGVNNHENCELFFGFAFHSVAACIRLRTVGEGVGSFAGNVWRVRKLAPRELYGVVPAYEYSYAESRVLTYCSRRNPSAGIVITLPRSILATTNINYSVVIKSTDTRH